MKKWMKIASVCALSAALCVPFAACGDTTTDITSAEDVYELYVAYAEENGDTALSYTEWLASIAGVGVSSVTSSKNDGVTTVTVTLTNGTTATFDIADGADGADGEDGADGAQGAKGDTGAQGEKGDAGEAGVSVTGATINSDGHLILTLSDGSKIDAGAVTESAIAAEKEAEAAKSNVYSYVLENYYEDLIGEGGDLYEVYNAFIAAQTAGDSAAISVALEDLLSAAEDTLSATSYSTATSVEEAEVVGQHLTNAYNLFSTLADSDTSGIASFYLYGGSSYYYDEIIDGFLNVGGVYYYSRYYVNTYANYSGSYNSFGEFAYEQLGDYGGHISYTEYQMFEELVAIYNALTTEDFTTFEEGSIAYKLYNYYMEYGYETYEGEEFEYTVYTTYTAWQADPNDTTYATFLASLNKYSADMTWLTVESNTPSTDD